MAWAACPAAVSGVVTISTAEANCNPGPAESLVLQNGGSVTFLNPGNTAASNLTINAGGQVLTNGIFLTPDGVAPNFSNGIINAGTVTGSSFGIRISQFAPGGASLFNAVSKGTNAYGIDNSGTIVANGGNGIYLLSGSSVSDGIRNTGTIRGTTGGSGGIGISIETNNFVAPAASLIGGLLNSGTIEGTGAGMGNTNHGVQVLGALSGGITNSGTIQATLGTNNYGISVGAAATLTGDITNTGTIAGSTRALDLANTASAFTVSTSGTITGAVALGINTLTITGGSISGNVTGGTGSVININGPFTTGATMQAATVNINSGGVLTANHNVTATGATTLNSGGIVTLGNNVTAYVGAGGFTNNSGGTGGAGATVGLSVAAGSMASITGGTYTQGATGIYQTGFSGHNATGDAPTAAYGRLRVGGDISLPAGAKIDVKVGTGATLTTGTVLRSVIAVDPTYGPGGTLTASTFAVSDNSTAYDFTAAINGTAVDLTVVDAPVAPVAAPAVRTPGKERDRPLMTTGIKRSIFSGLNSFNRVVQARHERNKGLSSGDDFLGDKQIWLKPVGSWAKQADNSGVSGYKADTYGFVMGVDGVAKENVRSGMAIAYAQSRIHGNRSLAEHDADVNGVRLIGYSTYSLDPNTDINVQVDVGNSRIEGRRVIDLGAGATSVASSSYDNWSYHLGAGLGRVLEIGPGSTFVPSVRLDYTSAKDKAYTETGAGANNLDVNANKADELILAADGKWTHAISEQTSVTANAGLGYDLLAKRATLTAAFVGGGAQFVTTGMDPQRVIGRLGLGVVTHTPKGTEITARYDYEARSGFGNHTASVKIRMPF